MNFINEPKPKKFCRLQSSKALPLIQNGDDLYRFKGEFNGYSVIVRNLDDMKNLVSMGYFGKANLSRNYPTFQHKQQILRERVYKNRKRFERADNKPEKLVVVPDSDEDVGIDDYFTNLQPRYELDRTEIVEFLCLNLEEAFFLCALLNCLEIYDENNELITIDKLWGMFQETDDYFLQNYVAYCYFRTKNWVVKPGIKFGGDFLLYKQGPPFYHASYVVIIQIVDANWKNLELTRRSMDAVSLASLNRLCETAGKELLICQIVWPDMVDYRDLSNIEIKEIIMRRWLSKQERQFEET